MDNIKDKNRWHLKYHESGKVLFRMVIHFRPQQPSNQRIFYQIQCKTVNGWRTNQL